MHTNEQMNVEEHIAESNLHTEKFYTKKWWSIEFIWKLIS